MAIFRNGIIAPFLMQANFGKLFFTESLLRKSKIKSKSPSAEPAKPGQGRLINKAYLKAKKP
jgi:hypothetical protein